MCLRSLHRPFKSTAKPLSSTSEFLQRPHFPNFLYQRPHFPNLFLYQRPLSDHSLSRVGKKTPMIARFSTVGGESGSADTARDPRGFALKFYTEEGNWDLVGNNTPIFFIRDPILFPSFIHTQKRNPKTHLKDANMFWDFISLREETTHQVTLIINLAKILLFPRFSLNSPILRLFPKILLIFPKISKMLQLFGEIFPKSKSKTAIFIS